ELEQHAPAALRIGGGEARSQTHACTGLDRSNKPGFVQAVVEGRGSIWWNDAELHDHRREQRQTEVAVGDRAAEWTLALRSLDIDMDPLAVAGADGELVDAILAHGDPVGDAELPPDEMRCRRHRIVENCRRHVRSQGNARRSLRRILPTFDFGSASRKRTSF